MSKVSKSKRAECLTQNLILKTGQKIVCHVSIKKEYNHLLNLRLGGISNQNQFSMMLFFSL